MAWDGTGTPVSGGGTPCGILDSSEWSTYGLTTGTATSTQVDIAASIAEDAIEAFLNTALCPTEATEKHTWPGPQLWRQGPRPLQLTKDRIISVDTVTTIHEEDKCDCETETYTGCSYIKDADTGIIEVVDDCWAGCCAECCTCSEGAFQVEVTYTYGFTAAQMGSDTSDGRTVRFWIAQWTEEILDAMLGNPSAVTAAGVIQWSSMNYSERLAVEVVKDTMFGTSSKANAMASSLRRLGKKRAVKFGGRR
jgi:hypothetical protein